MHAETKQRTTGWCCSALRRRYDRGARWSRRRDRAGSLFSLELLLVLPIVAAVCFGVAEFSLLMMGLQRVEAASSAACRVGTLPASNSAHLEHAVREAAAQALTKSSLVHTHEIRFDLGQFPGDPVWVEVRVPMTAAAPDLLRVLGFSLEGRHLMARTVMRKG